MFARRAEQLLTDVLTLVADTVLEKINAWGQQTYGDLSIEGIEAMHYERLGETVERLEALTITKRMGNTARLMANHRQNSGSDSGSIGGSSSLGRRTSGASSLSKPPMRTSYGASSAAGEPAPPPAYSTGAAGASSSLAGKRPAPPPPVKPRINATQYVTALYDYAATAEGDLSFAAGDKIEIVKKTQSTEDWWTGRLNGVEGVFPGNYVQS